MLFLLIYFYQLYALVLYFYLQLLSRILLSVFPIFYISFTHIRVNFLFYEQHIPNRHYIKRFLLSTIILFPSERGGKTNRVGGVRGNDLRDSLETSNCIRIL